MPFGEMFGHEKWRNACILLGIASIIFSAGLDVVSIVFLCNSSLLYALPEPNEGHGIKILRDAIFGSLLAAGSMMFFASILLLVGVKKNKPGLVLTYFACGVTILIVVSLSALLEVVHSYWFTATGQILFVLLYIPCLVMVNSAYDHILRDVELEDRQQRLLEQVSPIDGLCEND